MEIKDVQGNILTDALVTESAVKVEELMKQDSITLSWKAVAADELPLGAYVEHNGIRYSLLAPYKPQQLDEVAFEYKPVFHHPVMRWQYLPFFFYSNGTKETDWSLTDNPANFMSAVCEAISQETGENWSYSIASNLAASASLSFSNIDIFSALNSIASAFETEWWYDYANKVLHLSQAGHGEAVTLEVGKNISIPSATESKEGYATRFYVFGSTRNVDQNYSGSNTNSIVNRRLTLDPAKYPYGYIDIREGLTNEEILVKTLVFDDIYPRSSLTISDVRVRLMWRLDDNNQKVQIGTDSEGNPVYDQYAIWYFKIPSLSFSKDSIISGKALSVHFNSGPLNGREFELTYHEETKELENSDGVNFAVEAGDFEINFIEDGTFIIPAITGLIPTDGNSVTLFNIKMPQEYVVSAYTDLEDAAKAVISEQSVDLNNYSFESNPVEFFNSNPNLSVGRNVSFISGNYAYSTRVIKLETQLDRPFEQKITIGNKKIKGNTQELKEEVFNANQNIDLLSAINESTASFQQALQRSQKLMQEIMSASLIERINVGTNEKPKYAIRPVDFKGEEVGVVSDTFISAGGVNADAEGSGSGESFGRLDRWENYDADAGDVLSAVLGYDLKTQIEELRQSGGGEVVIGDITIKVGSDAYKAENGVVSLPAYPKNVSQLENDSNYLTEDKAAETYAPKDMVNGINAWFDLQYLPNGAAVLVTPHNIVSEKNISCGGVGEDMIAPSILRNWDDYNEEIMRNYSLSAKLGVELYNRITEEGKWKIL